jgi:hypothetical protein
MMRTIISRLASLFSSTEGEKSAEHDSTSKFVLDPQGNCDGTHFLTEIGAAPRRLVQLFGSPGEGDDYKASGTYCFSDEQMNVFTVYDWKETSLFWDSEDGDVDAPTPEEFWQRRKEVSFHIGGNDTGDVNAYKAWLQRQINYGRSKS